MLTADRRPLRAGMQVYIDQTNNLLSVPPTSRGKVIEVLPGKMVNGAVVVHWSGDRLVPKVKGRGQDVELVSFPVGTLLMRPDELLADPKGTRWLA